MKYITGKMMQTPKFEKMILSNLSYLIFLYKAESKVYKLKKSSVCIPHNIGHLDITMNNHICS